MLLIAINIFTYHNLTLINTNFISVLYKNLAPVKLYPRLLHVLIIVQNIFLYIISPSTQFNIFPFCSCFLNTWETRKVLQTNIHLWQFVFIQIVTFINALYSFLSIWVTVQWFYFFFFSLKDTPQSKSAGKCFSKPLNFFSCGTVFISSCLKYSFTGYRILGLESSFSTLNMSFFCLPWFLMISQLGIILRILCIWWVIFLSFFKFLFLSLSFKNLTVMCLGMDIWVYLAWNLPHFLDIYI